VRWSHRLKSGMPTLLGKITQPHSLFKRYSSVSDDTELFYTFSFNPYYSPNAQELTLSVLCKFVPEKSGANTLRVFITNDDQLGKTIHSLCDSKSFSEITDSLHLKAINFSQPLLLETVEIAKPWGKEIWYTGIEARGVCTVSGIPLPWLYAVNPQLFSTGVEALTDESIEEPILLKILAPTKEEVYGDLYFELHLQKIEVYVITHLDPSAWPSGVAEMRYGFCQEKLGEFEHQVQFTTAYLAAVAEYKTVRDNIDQILETQQVVDDPTSSTNTTMALVNTSRAQISKELIEKEKDLRATMESFTATRKVVVGDVIEVERRTPHSLQHGIRAIEFQSPHYERYILSFAQKVLTQDHWDTQKAMSVARLDATEAKALRVLSSAKDISIEIAADFDSFQVQRLSLDPGAQHKLTICHYLLVIGIIGEVKVLDQTIIPEKAFCLPSSMQLCELKNESTTRSVILVASPKANTQSLSSTARLTSSVN
jgi:hypothetical protein